MGGRIYCCSCGCPSASLALALIPNSPRQRNIEQQWRNQVRPSYFVISSPLRRHTAYIDNRQEQRDEANGPKNVDKSEAVFSMYLEGADIVDKEETERWGNECDVLLVFVGTLINLLSDATPMLMLNNVDWYFLRGSRGSSFHFYHRPSVKSTAILNGLYRKCSVFARQRHYNSAHHSPSTAQLTQFPSPGTFNMGQRTLVLEPGYQSYQRSAGGLYPSMGAFVPSGYSATTEPAGPCQNSYILCRRP